MTVAAPITCANGTYTNSTGLLSQDECTICPTSYYCNAGAIQGLCAAGVCFTSPWLLLSYYDKDDNDDNDEYTNLYLCFLLFLIHILLTFHLLLLLFHLLSL